MASPLQLYSFIQGEYEDGRKQHDTNRLRSLYQQALTDPSQNQRAIIGQVAAIDPTQAKGLYDLLNSRAEDQRKVVGQRAAMVRALPQDQRATAYQGFRPQLEEAGLYAPEGADEGYLGAVASTYGGLSAPQDSTPAAIRELQMLQANPELAALDMKRRTAGFDRPQLQIDKQGRPWFLSPGKPPTPAFGGQGAPTQVNYQTDDGQPIPADEQAALMQAIQASARGEDFTVAVPNGGDLSHIPPLSTFTGDGPRFGKPEATPEESFGQPQVVTDPTTGKQQLVQFGNRGGRRVVEGYAPPPTSRDAKPPTEGERNASGYLSRMEAAERELGSITAAGYSPGNTWDHYTAGQGPLLNWAATDEGQMYRQQQEDWVRAKLRKESGAVIGDEEMDREIRVYFPQPGDSQQVIQQKAQSRRIAIDAMRQAAGRAAQQQAASSGSRGPVRVKTAADYDALPSGAIYISPDGKQRRKR